MKPIFAHSPINFASHVCDVKLVSKIYWKILSWCDSSGLASGMIFAKFKHKRADLLLWIIIVFLVPVHGSHFWILIFVGLAFTVPPHDTLLSTLVLTRQVWTISASEGYVIQTNWEVLSFQVKIKWSWFGNFELKVCVHPDTLVIFQIEFAEVSATGN